jgi:hypothetical protein
MEHDAVREEDGAVVVGRLERGLVGGRPDQAAAHVAKIDEEASGVARPVVAPARQGEAAAQQRAPAGVGDDADEVAVGEHVGLRLAACGASGSAARPRRACRRRRVGSPPPAAGRLIGAASVIFSWSSSSVAWIRGSAWKRRTMTESSSAFASAVMRHALVVREVGRGRRRPRGGSLARRRSLSPCRGV